MQSITSLPAGIPDGSTRRRRGTARPGSKAAKLREAAIKTLKRHNAAIKSSELQKEIEKESGLEIPNMTTFMQSLIKMYPEVKNHTAANIFLREKFLRKQQKRQMIRLLNKTVKTACVTQAVFCAFPLILRK